MCCIAVFYGVCCQTQKLLKNNETHYCILDSFAVNQSKK